jgi:MFS family permease
LAIDLVPNEWRGRALGAYQAATGIALLPASVAFGVIYKHAGSRPPFILGAVLALTAILILPPQGVDNGRESFCGKLVDALGLSRQTLPVYGQELR